ncbi:MAG: hypothetical protein ASARMPREDX12_005409 [Alectoria sarmentosa]|nr:MAG: hypothetical protein ASARMPREDX12_005409 [Alectoria sarmentosa]
MTSKMALLGLIALPAAFGFPWMGEMIGSDGSLPNAQAELEKRQGTTMAGCPYNPNHVPAVPATSQFPYLGAVNGLPATHPVGNIEVPTDGDNAHNFVAPGPNDIRGPCPALNTAANHNFLSHDGITNLAELLDAQQNIWNLGYDLSMVLAVIGIGLTGDPVTTKMSIGCDATNRTSAVEPPLLGEELGVDAHNKFESDTSLSRSDFFFQTPNDFTFNGTLFELMFKTVGGNFSLPQMVDIMGVRYKQSLAGNPNFYFGPKVVLIYGAASFLFRLFPNFSGDVGPPVLHFIGGFFAAIQKGSTFVFSGGERILDDWHNRLTPWTLADFAQDLVTMYSMNPVLLGGNAGKVNDFDALGASGTGVIGVKNSLLSTNPNDLICLMYQIATEDMPSSLQTGLLPAPASVLAFATANLNPLGIFTTAGCTLLSTEGTR